MRGTMDVLGLLTLSFEIVDINHDHNTALALLVEDLSAPFQGFPVKMEWWAGSSHVIYFNYFFFPLFFFYSFFLPTVDLNSSF